MSDRDAGLRPQDDFVRNNIRSQDALVLSVGGNDIALKPTTATVISMLLLTRSPEWLIRLGWAPGFSHFFDIFHTRTEQLVKQLVGGKEKPACVVVCMVKASLACGSKA